MHHNIYLNPTGTQGSESTHYYYGNYRYHSRYPSAERDLNMFVQTMKNIECEDRPTVHATMARESGFTGLSILHRLYAAYGFNILKDLTFDAMHDITLNIIHQHLQRYYEAGILSRNEIDVRLPCSHSMDIRYIANISLICWHIN